MFKRFFGKKKERDLFEELFPLNAENKKEIETSVVGILKQMMGDGFDEHLNYNRNHQEIITPYKSLSIDTLGWEKEDGLDTDFAYKNEFGDFMLINTVAPNGVMKKNKPTKIKVYRNWARDMFVKMGGGLIICEQTTNVHGMFMFETISKVPRNGAMGMDYIYFLNISNFDEQLLYQIHIKVHDGSTTGMRDNILMSPISEVANMDMTELMNFYRKDPYDPKFTAGNTRNLSEMEAFDYLFPSHPLSIIRMDIKLRILKSLKFKN